MSSSVTCCLTEKAKFPIPIFWYFKLKPNISSSYIFFKGYKCSSLAFTGHRGVIGFYAGHFSVSQSKMERPTASLMYISRTVWARITKCFRHIHTDLPDICTGTTFGRILVPKKRLRCRSYGFRWNFSRKVFAMIIKFHTVFGDNWPQEYAYARYDDTSCFGRLQNAINHCTKVMRKTSLVGQRVE